MSSEQVLTALVHFYSSSCPRTVYINSGINFSYSNFPYLILRQARGNWRVKHRQKRRALSFAKILFRRARGPVEIIPSHLQELLGDYFALQPA